VLEDLKDGQLLARPEASFNRCSRSFSETLLAPGLRRSLPRVRRIFQAQTRHSDKILSLFEPHSVVIRKGKAHKPNEFGRLVRIDEVEKGLVSHYAVASGNLCDQQQWLPALQAHVELFGRAPQLAAADRGFWNSGNEKGAAQLGVKQVVLPGRGRLSATQGGATERALVPAWSRLESGH
jgi:IS5 family transposase